MESLNDLVKHIENRLGKRLDKKKEKVSLSPKGFHFVSQVSNVRKRVKFLCCLFSAADQKGFLSLSRSVQKCWLKIFLDELNDRK